MCDCLIFDHRTGERGEGLDDLKVPLNPKFCYSYFRPSYRISMLCIVRILKRMFSFPFLHNTQVSFFLEIFFSPKCLLEGRRTRKEEEGELRPFKKVYPVRYIQSDFYQMKTMSTDLVTHSLDFDSLNLVLWCFLAF